MTTLDPIEARLAAAFAIDLSPNDIGRLDERIGRALARPAPTRRFAMPAPRWFLRPLPLLAALALLTGSVIGASSLLDRLVESSGIAGLAGSLGARRAPGSGTDRRRCHDHPGPRLCGSQPGPRRVHRRRAPGRPGREHRGSDPDRMDRRTRRSHRADRRGMGDGPRLGTEADAAQVSANIHTWEGDVTPEAGTWVLTFTSVGYDGGRGPRVHVTSSRRIQRAWTRQ